MFRTVPLSIIMSLFTVHSAMAYVIHVCRQLSTNLYDIYHCWVYSELSETCRVLCKNKYVDLVHLVGFTIKKFVTMHGHMNVKSVSTNFTCQF
jgi:hypothetical protein